MKKGIKSKFVALTLATCSIINIALTSIHADEISSNLENIPTEVTDKEIETYLGGGPSPSAAWTYSKSYTKTYTSKQLNELSSQYQGNISSSSYNAGKFAYNVSLVALGFIGKKVGPITSATITLFGQTYHSEIQRSANVLAAAASKDTSVTLKVKEYIRPATGSTMILYY